MKWLNTPRKKIAFILVLVLAIILFYPFSIFVRGTLVPLYVNTFYKRSVDQDYSQTFSDLNSRLLSLGFTNNPSAATCYNGVSDSGNAWFHYFRETVPCMKYTTTNSVLLTDDFKARWKMLAPGIDMSLKAKGWVEDGNYGGQVSLVALHDEFTGYARETSYSKTQGKYSCNLIFSEEDSMHTTVQEACTRNVSFFGGYID